MSSGKYFRSARSFYRHNLETSINYNQKHIGVSRQLIERVLILSSMTISTTVLLVAFALSIWSPLGKPGDGTIFIIKDLNSIYVLVGGSIHPTDSIVNAYLITGNPSKPVTVAYSALNSFPKGPAMGIRGGPTDFNPTQISKNIFSICDTNTNTEEGGLRVTSTIYTPEAFTEPITNSDTPVFTIFQQKIYYILGGAKYLIPNNPQIYSALNLTSSHPIPISRLLFNFLPLKGTLIIPPIPDEGDPVEYIKYASGTVITSGTQEYVVTPTGLAPIPAPLGDALRNRNSHNQIIIPQVTQDIIINSPHTVIKALFPDHAPTPTSNPIVCGMWDVDSFNQTHYYSNSYTSAPGSLNDLIPTIPNLHTQTWGQSDIVAVHNGVTGLLIRTITGGTSEWSQNEGGLFYISNLGVRYGINEDPDTIQALGLQKLHPILAPWSIIADLPEGPYLSRKAALSTYNFWS